MGKLICLMGKSSTGKDTIYKRLLECKDLRLRTVIPYTTRPIRDGEREGKEYHFTDEKGFLALRDAGRVIEDRAYNTCHGLWRYFTVDDGSICLEDSDYLIIGTLEAYQKFLEYFGKENVLPVMVELDDGVRLERALNREKKQDQPKYEEMCRRFLADGADFSEEKMAKAGIDRRFYNDDLDRCTQEIIDYVKGRNA